MQLVLHGMYIHLGKGKRLSLEVLRSSKEERQVQRHSIPQRREERKVDLIWSNG